MSLTAPERETVITFSDEDDTAMVHTHQRPIITKLNKNPLATKIEDISFDGTAGAAATPAQVENLAKAREAQKLNPVLAESRAEAA